MALKIVKSSEPINVDRLNLVIYGPPGISKTSLAFTAAAPLLLDFDKGAHRAANRKDIAPVSSWEDVASIAAEDLAPFSTVIVDTAGRALDALTVDIIRSNPKMGRGGALTLQGYGELKARFTAFMKLMNSFGKDVVLIAHMDEQRNGDELIERLDVQGGSKGEIYKSADAMGRITIVNGQRRLLFSPTDASFGKNPGQLDPLNIPHFDHPEFDGFLARVIQQTKDKLNELTEDQRTALAEQQAFRDELVKIETVEGVNAMLDRARAGGDAYKRMLHTRATLLELVFNKEGGVYEAAPEPEAKAEEAETSVDEPKEVAAA